MVCSPSINDTGQSPGPCSSTSPSSCTVVHDIARLRLRISCTDTGKVRFVVRLAAQYCATESLVPFDLGKAAVESECDSAHVYFSLSGVQMHVKHEIDC